MKTFLIPATLACVMATAALAQDAKAPEDITIALVPGLTTDAFYITMNRGAQAAAEALGIKVDFQGAEEFDPVLQTPVLDAVTADGDLTVPIDTDAWGIWLKGAFGAPTTTGTTNFTPSGLLFVSTIPITGIPSLAASTIVPC